MTQVESASPAPRTGAGRVERARQQEARRIARRSFLRVSVFAGLTLFIFSQIAGFLGFFNKLKPTGFGGVVNVPASRIPSLGSEPVRITESKSWLVNLQGPNRDGWSTSLSRTDKGNHSCEILYVTELADGEHAYR